MKWATRRKFLYIALVLAAFMIVVALPSYLFLYKPPTCFDGKQNQTEQGVDCGGPCVTVCPAQAIQPIVLWQRVFKVNNGIYNAIAFVENPNLDSVARTVGYSFRVYDTDNILIAQRTGTIDVLPNQTFPIFEPNLLTGERIPMRVTFAFTGPFVWKKTRLVLPDVQASNIVLSKTDSEPRLDTLITNNSLKVIQNLPVVVIMYDTAGTAVAASRTFIDKLDKTSSTAVTFTWPQPFGVSISEKDIYPLVGLAD